MGNACPVQCRLRMKNVLAFAMPRCNGASAWHQREWATAQQAISSLHADGQFGRKHA